MSSELLVLKKKNSSKIKHSKRKIKLEKLEKMAEILKAISHHYRLEVLEVLEGNGELSVAQILEQINIEQSLLSHHLNKMKDKGILSSRREGRNIYYHLAFKDITKLFDCMEQCDAI